jgi:hypothetical protein
MESISIEDMYFHNGSKLLIILKTYNPIDLKICKKDKAKVSNKKKKN